MCSLVNQSWRNLNSKEFVVSQSQFKEKKRKGRYDNIKSNARFIKVSLNDSLNYYDFFLIFILYNVIFLEATMIYEIIGCSAFARI